jgi:hypothetical protein
MLVTRRPSKLDIAWEQSVKKRNGKEITSEASSENTTQLQRRRHAGTGKNHYVLLLSECILKYGRNSIKLNSATDKYKRESNLSMQRMH